MTQDFAKIRPEPILEKKPAQAPPAWSLMVTGILLGITIGVFACVIFYLSGKVPALNVGPSVANSTADLSQVERIEDEYQNSSTVLISDIKKDLDIPIINMIDYGVESKFKESLLMGLLGYSRINKIKSNMPSVTGASNEVILGDIYES